VGNEKVPKKGRRGRAVHLASCLATPMIIYERMRLANIAQYTFQQLLVWFV